LVVLVLWLGWNWWKTRKSTDLGEKLIHTTKTALKRFGCTCTNGRVTCPEGLNIEGLSGSFPLSAAVERLLDAFKASLSPQHAQQQQPLPPIREPMPSLDRGVPMGGHQMPSHGNEPQSAPGMYSAQPGQAMQSAAALGNGDVVAPGLAGATGFN
jgi:hypothetical protein